MTDGLERYAAARDEIAGALEELRALLAPAAHWHEARDDLDGLAAHAERLRNGRFVLAVVGEFSSGKSFLLNALLGKIALDERPGANRITGLLATDINPSTATITELSYSREERAVAAFADGREERVPIDGLRRFVAIAQQGAFHDATSEVRDAPAIVRVGVDSAFLRNGFVVADTPGLASINPAHRRATLGYLPGADAVLYLIDTQQPFSDGDASFLGIVRRYLESIFIVQTKIDLWRNVAGDHEAWQTAAARIVAQAGVHAPDTPVFPLSAREYAEGCLTGNGALIAQSRFPPFLGALDAELVATAGRARLRGAAREARRLADRAAQACALETAALEASPADLIARREAAAPRFERVAATAGAARSALLATGSELREQIDEFGVGLRARLERALARAFDVADIARLRDRAKLHIIVDQSVAGAMDAFAGQVAEFVHRRLEAAAQDAVAAVAGAFDAIAGQRLPVAEDTARAFDADSARGAWRDGVEPGLRGTIVLGALGGPSVALVTAIASRFATTPYGRYMKRELIADMGTEIAPAFDREVALFVGDIGARVERASGMLADRVDALAVRIRTDSLGAIDRALAAGGSGAHERANGLRVRAADAAAVATRIETRSEHFARESRVERRDLADPAVPLDPFAGRQRVEPDTIRFDPQTYEHGLRPERWRVVVIGAFKRGKSALINALARGRVLEDEDGEADFRFPVHVRYGPQARVSALSDDAAWEEIPATTLFEAAARTPVLVETPWELPRELVLVHAPAFDAGQPLAEEITSAAAAAASEILVLFSRQLSDRELELYARLARLGPPMTFVHTIADNETSAERRNVVELANRYLGERTVVPQRIFTISTRSFRDAGWNELNALRATLVTHAEEHMERLRRAQRQRTEQARLANAVPPPEEARTKRKRTLLERILGSRR